MPFHLVRKSRYSTGFWVLWLKLRTRPTKKVRTKQIMSHSGPILPANTIEMSDSTRRFIYNRATFVLERENMRINEIHTKKKLVEYGLNNSVCELLRVVDGSRNHICKWQRHQIHVLFGISVFPRVHRCMNYDFHLWIGVQILYSKLPFTIENRTEPLENRTRDHRIVSRTL